MPKSQIHSVQVAVLRALRRAPVARFSELMRGSGLQSDAFKFHIKKLQALGYVAKDVAGSYSLTPQGKEFANNLDEAGRVVQKQPKLSVMLIVERQTPHGAEYLFQQRKRNPYFDYWGLLSGPVQWGEDAERTAARELRKQTGLQATFVAYAFYRQKDFLAETRELLEDKLFVVLKATEVQGELSHDWTGGRTEWLTIDTLLQQPKYFNSTTEVLALMPGQYVTKEMSYAAQDY